MSFGELAVKKALEQGMDEAEAIINVSKNIQVQFAYEVQNIRTTFNTQIGFRVAKGKKVASYTSTLLSEGEIDNIVNKTIKIAKVSPDDPHWNGLNAKVGQTPAEKLFDSYVDKLDYDEITGKINEGINTVDELGKAIVVRGTLNIAKSNLTLTTSNNETMERKGTRFVTYFMTKARKGGESTYMSFM